MSLEIRCACPLCAVEARLLAELVLADSRIAEELLIALPSFGPFLGSMDLVARLRCSPVDGRSDDLLRPLVSLRAVCPSLVEPLLVLAFVPMLHRTVHLVTARHFTLSQEDVSQEALRFFLEFIASEKTRVRRTHFAFAISREVKRHVFRWAARESRKMGLLQDMEAQPYETASMDSSLERLTELRHFLHQAVTRGILTETDLNLLVDFKLNGGTLAEGNGCNGISPNATRQKLKRLLAKLRRLAAKPK